MLWTLLLAPLLTPWGIVIGLIVAAILLYVVWQFVGAFMPYAIAILVILVLLHILMWIMKMNSPKPRSSQEESGYQDIASICRSTYSDEDSIRECIRNGGAL